MKVYSLQVCVASFEPCSKSHVANAIFKLFLRREMTLERLKTHLTPLN